MAFALYFLHPPVSSNVYSIARVHRGQSTPDNSQLRFYVRYTIDVHTVYMCAHDCVGMSFHTNVFRVYTCTCTCMCLRETATFIEPPYATMQSIITRSWINVQAPTKALVGVCNMNTVWFSLLFSTFPYHSNGEKWTFLCAAQWIIRNISEDFTLSFFLQMISFTWYYFLRVVME